MLGNESSDLYKRRAAFQGGLVISYLSDCCLNEFLLSVGPAELLIIQMLGVGGGRIREHVQIESPGDLVTTLCPGHCSIL